MRKLINQLSGPYSAQVKDPCFPSISSPDVGSLPIWCKQGLPRHQHPHNLIYRWRLSAWVWFRDGVLSIYMDVFISSSFTHSRLDLGKPPLSDEFLCSLKNSSWQLNFNCCLWCQCATTRLWVTWVLDSPFFWNCTLAFIALGEWFCW